MVLIKNDMPEQSRRGLKLNHLTPHRLDGKFQPGFPEQLRTPGACGDHNPVRRIFPGRSPDPPDRPALGHQAKHGRVLMNLNTLQIQ